MLLMMNDKSQQILSGVEVIYGPVSYSFQIFLRFNFTLSLCLSYELWHENILAQEVRVSVISVWSEKYFTLQMKGKCLSKVNRIPQMCGVCVCVDVEPGGWWRAQTRPGTQPIRSRLANSPCLPLPLSSQPGRPFPRVIRLEELVTASSLGHWHWYGGLLILMSQSLLLELPSWWLSLCCDQVEKD